MHVRSLHWPAPARRPGSWARVRSWLADVGPSLAVCAVSVGLFVRACNADPEPRPRDGRSRSWIVAWLAPEKAAPRAPAPSAEAPRRSKRPKLRKKAFRVAPDVRDALVMLARSAPVQVPGAPPSPVETEPATELAACPAPAPPTLRQPTEPPAHGAHAGGAPPPHEPAVVTVASARWRPPRRLDHEPPTLLARPLAEEPAGRHPAPRGVGDTPAPSTGPGEAVAQRRPEPAPSGAPSHAPASDAMPVTEPGDRRASSATTTAASGTAPVAATPPSAPEVRAVPGVGEDPGPPPVIAASAPAAVPPRPVADGVAGGAPAPAGSPRALSRPPTALAAAPPAGTTTSPRSTKAPQPKRVDRPRRPTPMSPNDATRYLAKAWEQHTGERATEEVISVLWGQWALETGRGRWMVDYNYAGLKGRAPDGGTANWWTWEEAEAGARRVRARFRSYETPEQGALDYVELLLRRYPRAVAAARRGDAVGFILELDRGGFFSERPEHYVRSVASLAREFRRDRYAVLFEN